MDQSERGRNSIDRLGEMVRSVGLCNVDCFKQTATEELNPSEGDSELNGWSVRTRIVARYLQRSFQNRKKQMEEETVNLMQILRGRTKKESARLFYEILVLKSRGFVDVKQDSGYVDILVKDSSLVGAVL